MYRNNHTSYNDQPSMHHKTSTKFRSHRQKGALGPRCKSCRHKLSVSSLSFCHRYCIISNTIVHHRTHFDGSSQVSWAAIYAHITPTVSFLKSLYGWVFPTFPTFFVHGVAFTAMKRCHGANVSRRPTDTPSANQYRRYRHTKDD